MVHALEEADAPHVHVSHVHVLGSGVDRVVSLVREHAARGQRGDGLIAVTPLERIVGIRTGEEDLLAVV